MIRYRVSRLTYCVHSTTTSLSLTLTGHAPAAPTVHAPVASTGPVRCPSHAPPTAAPVRQSCPQLTRLPLLLHQLPKRRPRPLIQSHRSRITHACVPSVGAAPATPTRCSHASSACYTRTSCPSASHTRCPNRAGRAPTTLCSCGCP